MGLEFKRVPFEVKDLPADGGAWEFSGYASTFGSVDLGGDRIDPAAFDATLMDGKSRPLLFSHDDRIIIGGSKRFTVDEHGLFGVWDLVDTSAGTDVYKLLKRGHLTALSIGYVVREASQEPDGTRLLKSVDLFEVSAVAVGMNPHATVTDVKGDLERRAVWSAAMVNDFPDSSFALVLPGGSKDSEGKTTPRSLRKLPHHSADGSLDAAHVRNGLSRAPQMTGVSDAQRSRAVSHLEKHLAALNKAAEHEAPAPHVDVIYPGHEARRRRLLRLGVPLESVG